MDVDDAPTRDENVADVLRQIAEASRADAKSWAIGRRSQTLAGLLSPVALDECEQVRLPVGFLLSVIMPVFNEVGTIEEIIRKIKATGIPCEIVVVDDGSTDGTRELLEKLRTSEPVLRVVLHERNRGKGAALKTGFAAAKGDVVLIQDADLEYDPTDYHLLLVPFLVAEATAVYGSRYLCPSPTNSNFLQRRGNHFITKLSNWFTRLKLTDVETCYKLFRREALQPLVANLRESGFGIEIELTAKLAKLPDAFIHELPIRFSPRSYAEGKKINWRDGLWALWCVLRY